MSNRGRTREQPSIEDPARLSVEHVCLAVAVVALTVALSGLYVQATTSFDLLRGAYSVLAALAVCGFVGFIGTLVLRRLAALMALLLEVRELLRQRQGAGRQMREPVKAGGQHRSGRGGDQFYWTVYTDVLEDLGGLDEGPSRN